MIKARDLFLALETSPIAPDDEFQRFVVGNLLDESFIRLRIVITEMIAGKQPSRLQLIVGENGNGKTLLANRVKRFLSEENEGEKAPNQVAPSRRFDVLYSHISALGQASSQTSLEIATNLRRSRLEEPEITYSLLAAEIAKEFAVQYEPPLLWRLLKLVGRAGLDIVSLGIYGKLEEALRDKSAEQIRHALDTVSGQFQKSLNNKYYRAKFEEFLGDLVGFDPFVKIYFPQNRAAGIDRLRADFLKEIDAPAFQQPKQVVDQLARLAKKVRCQAIVVIIDDCNQTGFVDQLLPLINELSKFTNPRIFLIVNMVQSLANELENKEGDESGPQRLFYNEPIQLSGPKRGDIVALYGRLRTLYNEAFSGESPSIPDSITLRDRAVRGWSTGVTNGSLESNYRSAIRFLIACLRQQGSVQLGEPAHGGR